MRATRARWLRRLLPRGALARAGFPSALLHRRAAGSSTREDFTGPHQGSTQTTSSRAAGGMSPGVMPVGAARMISARMNPRSNGALYATGSVPCRSSSTRGMTVAKSGAPASSSSVMPCTARDSSGTGTPGLTSKLSRLVTLPLVNVTRPTSITRSVSESRPVVSKSMTVNGCPPTTNPARIRGIGLRRFGSHPRLGRQCPDSGAPSESTHTLGSSPHGRKMHCMAAPAQVV